MAYESAQNDDGGEEAMTPLEEARRASRLVQLAWLMLPLLLISTVLAVVFAVVVSSIAGIDPVDPLADQGILGWVVFVGANMLLWPLPSYFGLRFALGARELGADAIIPLIAHSFVIAIIWLLALFGIIREIF